MKRPDFITNEDIARWDDNIDNDEKITDPVAKNPILREVCYAGLWLAERLVNLGCPLDIVVRIQYTAAQLSFGHDIWGIHQEILDDYENDRLEFEMDYSEDN